MNFPGKMSRKISSVAKHALVLFAVIVSATAAISAQKVILAPMANPNLDQCANGGAPGPRQACTGNNWQNGNLNSNNSQYIEGESAPYRVIFTGTANSASSLTIEYDTTKAGKHAIDYLTTYNRTEVTGNNPCDGVAGCSLLTFSTMPIPIDPDVTAGFDQIPGNGDDITQVPGVFTLFGGTITSVSAYSLSGSYAGDSTRSITVNFTIGGTGKVVLAFSGHTGRRLDWGINNSAINISGAPYHVSVGGANASMQIDALTFPAIVTITKLVTNLDLSYSSVIPFGFTSSANYGTTSFSLTDSDPAQFGGASYTNAAVTAFGAGNTITVTENASTIYTLGGLACTESPGGIPAVLNTTVNFATRTANIVPDEGEIINCTFSNTQLIPSAARVAISGRVVTSDGSGVRGAALMLTNVSTGETRSATSSSFGYYTFTELPVDDFYVLTVQHKKYSFASNMRSFALFDELADIDFIANP